jgi:hypothetical protein
MRGRCAVSGVTWQALSLQSGSTRCRLSASLPPLGLSQHPQPAPPAASDPPRSRLGARRRYASSDSPRTRRSGRRARSREHQDVEQLGAGSRTEGVEALLELALELVGSHGREATPLPGHGSEQVTGIVQAIGRTGPPTPSRGTLSTARRGCTLQSPPGPACPLGASSIGWLQRSS